MHWPEAGETEPRRGEGQAALLCPLIQCARPQPCFFQEMRRSSYFPFTCVRQTQVDLTDTVKIFGQMKRQRLQQHTHWKHPGSGAEAKGRDPHRGCSRVYHRVEGRKEGEPPGLSHIMSPEQKSHQP